MSLRSPLSRVLGFGSAKDGTGHWWAQRVTAAGLVILGLWFLFGLLQLESFEYLAVVRWAAKPINSVMLILLCLTLAYHSSLGIQVIVEDYVHGHFAKVLTLILSNFAHIFVAMAAVFAVLKIAFGTAV